VDHPKVLPRFEGVDGAIGVRPVAHGDLEHTGPEPFEGLGKLRDFATSGNIERAGNLPLDGQRESPRQTCTLP
jgi:hypothetical protein